MKQKLVCSSCKKEIANDEGTVMFKCPNCGKVEITRCRHCRLSAVKYKCKECNFEGPN